jgi:hypothetical protein
MHWFSSSQPPFTGSLAVIVGWNSSVSVQPCQARTLDTGGATKGSIEAGGKARGKIGATAPSQCASTIHAVNVQRRGCKLTACAGTCTRAGYRR